MPNIRRQIVGDLSDLGGTFVGTKGLHITFSDGRSITITRSQVLSHFASETGTRAQKKAKTLVWLRDQIVNAGGQEQISPTAITQDIDDTTGDITNLEVL